MLWWLTTERASSKGNVSQRCVCVCVWTMTKLWKIVRPFFVYTFLKRPVSLSHGPKKKEKRLLVVAFLRLFPPFRSAYNNDKRLGESTKKAANHQNPVTTWTTFKWAGRQIVWSIVTTFSFSHPADETAPDVCVPALELQPSHPLPSWK